MDTVCTSVGDVVAHVAARRDRPWLIVGKGPSTAWFEECVEPGRFLLFTLNHACRLIPPDDAESVAHFMDLEAAAVCCDDVQERACKVCTPWYPHYKFKPGRRPVEPDVFGLPRGTERLLAYNSTVAHNLPQNHLLPRVRVRFFSAVAAFNILALAGCRTIHSIGVDGGARYDPRFDDGDRLANGRPGFDVQFLEIDHTARRLKIEHVRLGREGAA